MTGALLGAVLVLPCQMVGVAPTSHPQAGTQSPALVAPAATPKAAVQGARVPFVLDTAAALGDVTAKIRWDELGRLRSVRGTLGYLAPGDDAPVNFVATRASHLGLSPAEQWWVSEDTGDPHGYRHVRLNREAFGLVVVGDWIGLHVDAQRQVRGIELGLTDLSRFQYEGPRVSPWEAVAYARRGYEGALSDVPSPVLVITARRPGGRGELAYRVRISYRRPGTLPYVRDVFVSALNGRILREQARVYTQATTMPSMDLLGNTVQLNVTAFTQSVLMQDRVSLPNGGEAFSVDVSRDYVVFDTPDVGTPFADTTAVTAHDSMAGVLDYFRINHGWQNWNFAQSPAGLGGLLAAYVHEGDQLNNAYFTTASSNGDVFGIMAFGDGDGNEFNPLPLCFDVTGHEMGHGVVQGTADLAYQFQSGALNEHYADVFGWLADPGDDLIGEECVGPALMPAIRDMCDPPSGASPQPDHMNDFEDLPNTEEGDWGGVHINSGIPNRAACVARATLGAQKLGDVWFQALRFHLGPDSNFADMVDATSAACGELGTTTGQDCADVAQAWISVGLGTPSSGGGCPANSTLQDGACFCDPGYVPNAAGDACEAEPSITCPLNSTPYDGACYCDEGYIPSEDASECVPESQGPCPDNAHREGGVCVCDECFQGNPERNGFGCDAIPGCVACPDPLEEDGGAGSCVCVSGITETCGPQSANYDFDDMGTIIRGEDCCQESDPCGWAGDGFCDCFGECSFDTVDCSGASSPGPVCRGTIPGDCGDETWAGRCDGSWLVYCDDVTDPMNPIVRALDCDVLGEVCAWETDLGFTCVDPSNNCGSVPDTGFCNGNIAQYCDGGVLMEVDCDNKPCGERIFQGETLQFCLPCPVNATLIGSDCVCDSGFEPDSTATNCVPIPDPMPMPCGCDTTPGVCDGNCTCDTDCLCPCDRTTACDENCDCDPECSGGGCAATSTQPLHGGLWLWACGLALLLRKRSQS